MRIWVIPTYVRLSLFHALARFVTGESLIQAMDLSQ